MRWNLASKPSATKMPAPAKPAPARKATAKKAAPKKMAPPPKPAKPTRAAKGADWDAIERDYRTGRFTFRELEAKHGVPNTTIMRRQKRDGWSADLSKAVRQATNAALIQAQVQQECSDAQQNAATTVLAAAEVNKQVILGHRKHVASAIALASGLMDELRMLGTAKEDLERLAEIVGGDDPEEMLRTIRKVTSVHTKVSSVKTLADAIDKLMRAERLAFGIDDEGGKPPRGDEPPANKYEMSDDELRSIAAAGRS